MDRKVGEAKGDTDRNASSYLYSEMTNKISKINADLSELKLLVDNYDDVPFEFGTIDKLRLIGFRSSTLNIFDDLKSHSRVTQFLHLMLL